MTKLISSIRASAVLLLVFTLLLGVVYPLAVMAVSQIFFADKAAGSLIIKGDAFVGSRLLGQEFSDPKYFWGRLSATTPPYNAANSTGSNLNPGNPKVKEAAGARVEALRAGEHKGRIPIDLVTASASGLDPHISLAAALYQLPRVAAARGIKESDVRLLIKEHTQDPYLGFIGEPLVNVLELNLALDQLSGFGIQDSGKKK